MMRLKSEVTQDLKELIQDVGIPKEIHTDCAMILEANLPRSRDKVTQTKKYLPWQNCTEVNIERNVR